MSISAVKADGSLAGNVSGLPGSVVVIGEEPMLTAALGSNSTPTLTLYGNPGVSYQILHQSDLAGTNWLPVGEITLTNMVQTSQVIPSLPLDFYRAQESPSGP